MRIEPKAPTKKGPSEWFVGDVFIDVVHTRKAAPSRLACGLVHFTPGSRTAWHSHEFGQTLYVTSGVALVGTRDGKVLVGRPGDVVYTPPGEEHWHGAAPDSFMSHLALYEGSVDGEGATWLEHVSENDYVSAGRCVDRPLSDALDPSTSAGGDDDGGA